jgi:hypothetical protein
MNLRRLLPALILVACARPSVALAQVSDSEKAAARQLTLDGYSALEKKDYAAAADRFKRAESLFHAPTMTLGFARAQVGLGKLVSAQEAYSRLVHETLPAGAPAAFAQAIEDGRTELAALGARIPSLVIQVRGAEAPKVTIDGVAVPGAALGVNWPVDPGPHVVRATAPGAAAKETTVTMVEGKTQTLALDLVPAVAEPAPPSPPAPTPPPPAAPTPPPVSAPPPPMQSAPPASLPPRADSPSGSVRKPVGFGALGVGAVGLAVGGIMAGLAAGKHGDLAKLCPTGVCALGLQHKLQPDVDSYPRAPLQETPEHPRS